MSVADPAVDQAERLCAVLTRVGDAMVTLDARALLEMETDLAQAVRALPGSLARVEDRAAARLAVKRARAALLRCRRLGASFSAVARVRLGLCAGQGTYSRVGQASSGLSGVAVKVTV